MNCRSTRRLHRFAQWVEHWFTDKRFVLLVCCLLIGFFSKYVVFQWSVGVVENFQILTGFRTHGVMVGVGDNLVLEHFDDWTWYYEVFASRFLQGHLPYTPALYEITPGHQTYVYPPLFLYLLVGLSFLPGPYGMVGGIVFFDLITGICLFLVGFQITQSSSRASLAMLIYYLNPVTLWWTDFCWFGEALYTGLLVISILFLMQDRFLLASLFLGLACMTKQVAIIFVPLLVILAAKHSRQRLLASLLILTIIFLLLSFPYLIIMPDTYFQWLFLGARPFLYIDVMPPFNSPVQLFASFWFLPAFMRNAIAIAVYTYVPLVIACSLIYLYILFFLDPSSPHYKYSLVFTYLILSLSFLVFFPRGIFKWYLIGFIPFFALATVCVPGKLSARVPTWKPIMALPQRIGAIFGSNIILAASLYFIASFTLTWVHRWLGPGILLFCLIGVTGYWIVIGRKRGFSTNIENI